MSAATTVSGLLPQLQAIFAQVPAGVNPFAGYAVALWKASYPGVIPWSKPIFILVIAVAAFNLLATFATLYIRSRQEGLSFYKLREHKSGGKYITLNSINIFLVCNIVTCLVFMIYPGLHITYYDQPGHAYMDLGWATMMWMAPYVGLLMTSLGVLYGILVAPSPLATARRGVQDGNAASKQPPLAFLPCWLLNGFIFAAPLGLVVAVSIPASRLLNSVKTLEEYGLVVHSMLLQNAAAYASTGVSQADQVAMLQAFAKIKALDADSASKWRPVYGVWSAFVGIAVILAIIAFFAVRAVTKTRLALAGQQQTNSLEDSGTFELGNAHAKSSDPFVMQALRQARFEHYNLCFQFGGAAVLLVLCFGMLLFDCIKGWEVHTDPNLLALALLIVMIAYYAQSTPTVALILYRAFRGRDMAGNAVRPAAPASSDYTHSREASDASTFDAKKLLFNGARGNTGFETGTVFVTGLEKHAFPVSPSVVHQIQIDQVIQTSAESQIMSEKDTYDPPSMASSTADLHRSASPASQLAFADTYGRAL